MEEKITIDRQTFKALASDSRVHILKLLDKRRHTQSEISAELSLSVPTVKEHLEALEKANLVKKFEEGYKWKYYALTEKGKCLLDPERKKVWILLASFLVAAIAGFMTLMSRMLFAGSAEKLTSAKSMAAESVQEAAPTLGAAAVRQPLSPITYILIFFAILLAVLLILLVYYLAKSRILRKKP